MPEQYDVAIVGGGPAGSTAATLLARKGHSVLLLEKEKFPRYHIGESTIPGMLPILEELGVKEEITRRAFVVKKGVTLAWGRDSEPWSVGFADAGPLVGPYDYAFQVVRSEFDNILLNNARRSGAMVLEEASVVDFLFEQGRYAGLKYVLGQNGAQTTVHARFVIDASGQNALHARKQGLLEWDERLKNVAIWAYYQGGLRLEGNASGNILIENMVDGGWLWVIPLHNGTQSVGLVMPTGHIGGRQALEQTFVDRLASSVHAKRLLASAQRVSNCRTARDWSYRSKAFYSPGLLLAGDAAGFVDPLFSTGVFLALRGGRLASETVDRLLKEPEKETELLALYEKSYRDVFDAVISFIHYFYDVSKTKESYWEVAQQLIDPTQQATKLQDFVRLISGLIGSTDVMRLDPTQDTHM